MLHRSRIKVGGNEKKEAERTSREKRNLERATQIRDSSKVEWGKRVSERTNEKRRTHKNFQAKLIVPAVDMSKIFT